MKIILVGAGSIGGTTATMLKEKGHNIDIIEANHDVQMLQESDRDITLKRRILSSTGHLSNKTCYEVLEKLLTDKYKYVILAHISRECNSVECIKRDIINKVNVIWNGKIVIASQDECTELMEI